MKRYIYYIIAAGLALAACTPQDGKLSPEELGVTDDQISVECVPGTASVSVLSDGNYTAALDDQSWISFSGTTQRSISGSGDGSIELSYELNRGIIRQSVLTLTRGRKTVRVTITQKGILSSDISFPNRSVTIDGAGGNGSVKILSVYKDEDLDIGVIYVGGSGWISDVHKENNFINFTTLENSSDETRNAFISVVSRKNPEIGDVMQLVQLGSGIETRMVSFEEVKSLLSSAGSITIDENIVVEAVVTGDNNEGNGGENSNISANLQDLTLSGRTAYIQNSDASSGFKVVFNTVLDNITVRYNRISLLLNGVTLERKGGRGIEPVHYVISNVSAANILQLAEGSIYDVPAKVRSIGELTDDDVYTFVTLRDCEIPIRKGPFVPIDIRHNHVIHSYPMVIRDINGDNAHLITNLSAAWQRDGKGLPQGSGSISGVIVHETCDNFEWDSDEMARRMGEGIMTDYVTGIGHIGMFQIRPFRRSEIALNEKFEDGFSEMIMEIRYYAPSGTPLVQNVASNKIYSTYPAVPDPVNNTTDIKGYLQLTDKNNKAAGTAVYRDWTHLGPMENGVITDPSLGNGVFDFYGVASEWEPYSTVRNNALIMKSSAFYKSSNWSTEQSWKAVFSTKGLTEANFPLSVQFGACSGLGQSVGAPRYWILEYSVDDSDWYPVEEYTVPDFPILSARRAWQCPAYKFISITLPEDAGLLDCEEVYVRLRPVNTLAGTIDAYDGSEIVKDRATQLNYFAIRYNK